MNKEKEKREVVNQIVEQELENKVAVSNSTEDYDSDTLDSSDIKIPRLVLLQGLSEGVAEKAYNAGDILDTDTKQVLGGNGEFCEVIPFFVTKVCQKFRSDVVPKEYVCTEPYNNQTWEEPKYLWERFDGTSVECSVVNYKTYIVHAMVVNDDIDMSLPVTITFKSMAGKEGGKIASHFATVKQFNDAKKRIAGFKPQPGFNSAWMLSSELVKDRSQTYFKWTCKKVRPTTTEERDLCVGWAAAIAENTKKYIEQAAEPMEEIEDGGGNSVKVETDADAGDIPF